MSRSDIACSTAAFLAVIAFASLCAADAGLALKWNYNAQGTIWAVSAGDVNGDKVSEVVYASSNSVSVLDASGKFLRSFPLKFNATVLYLADIDGDGKDEILAGSGWINTSEVNGSRFDFSDPANFREKPEYLYKTMRSQGDVWVLDWNAKEPEKRFEVGEWVRGIYVDDLEGDGNTNIIVASGGSGINYIEKLTTGIDNITKNLTYIRNYTESYIQNGSVSIFFSNGSLKSRYRTKVPIASVHSMAYDNRTMKTVLAGTSAILVLSGNASLKSTIKPLRENASIIDIDGGDLNGDGEREIIASFVEPAVSGAYVFDRNGKFIWEYRVPSRNVLASFYINIDADETKEIVLVSQDGIYVLNNEGKLVRSTHISGGAERAYVADLGDDPYVDFITSYRSSISVYEVDETFMKEQAAGKYYAEAERNYQLANYQAAVGNITAAMALYEELGDQDGLAKTNQLSDKIELELKKIKRDAADSLFSKGESQFYYGKYADAEDSYQKAREIYQQINDSEGVSKSEAKMAEVANLITSKSTTTSISQAVSGPTTTVPDNLGQGISTAAFIVLGLIVLALLAYALNLGRKMKDEDKEEDEAKKKRDE